VSGRWRYRLSGPRRMRSRASWRLRLGGTYSCHPVGSSLGDGSDVALFGGEVGLATASTHDDGEGVGGLGSVERIGPQLANVTGGYVLPAAWNAVEAGAVPPKCPSPRSGPREGASDPDGDSNDRGYRDARLGIGSAAAGQTNKAQRQDTLSEAAEPSLHHAPPHRSSIHLRDRSDRGGQGPADICTTLIASRRCAILARRLVDNRPHPDSTPRSGEAPEHNRCGWRGPLAYNVLCCTQKRRQQRRLHRVSTAKARAATR
jgi:hypothetical protein